MLSPGRLLVLPTYRVKVTLTIGVNLDILGGSQVELLASGPREPPGIRVPFGRVVIAPLGKAGSRLRVKFGDRGGEIGFADAESVAAIDVRRIHVPGTNPEGAPDDVVANLYAVTGGVSWAESGAGQAAEPLQLTPLQRVTFDGQATSPPAAAKELPRWVVAEPTKPLDPRASADIAKSLSTDRPARVGLAELTSRPQREVRWLALRCLGYVGQFRDMVLVLNEPAQRLVWPEYVEQLRDAVARDSQTAAVVHQTLEQQFPQQAAELYRMLWGYSDRDLQSGADKELVAALNDDLLAVRVLAISNLKDITGVNHGYNPTDTILKRKLPTQRWQQLLDGKKIRLKTSEEKEVAPREPVAPPAAPPES
jgi:hypothetical protein